VNKSESIKEIASALAKFQAEVKDPVKDSDNPFFKSKYVELDGLLAAVRPVLSKNGLSFIQSPGGNGQDITITTLLMHSSGEWIEFDPLTLHAVKTDPQGAGSAITYARRYALSAILGVAWDADDDGNKASISGKKDSGNTNTQTTKQQLTEPKQDVYACESCKKSIPQGVHAFSIKKYGKSLCQDCQKKAVSA